MLHLTQRGVGDLFRAIKDGYASMTTAGQLTVATLIATTITFGVLTVTGGVDIGTSLHVGGKALFTGSEGVGITGPVAVTGAVDLASTLKADTINEHTTDAGVTIDLLKIENEGTYTTLLGASGDYNRIGDAGTTGHSLNSEDDFLITGKLEVDGISFFDSLATLASALVSGLFTASGPVWFGANFHSDGSGVFDNNFGVGGKALFTGSEGVGITGPLATTGPVDCNSTLNVDGAATLKTTTINRDSPLIVKRKHLIGTTCVQDTIKIGRVAATDPNPHVYLCSTTDTWVAIGP